MKGLPVKNLQEVTEKICELKGEAIGMRAMLNAILSEMPASQFAATLQAFDELAEAETVLLLNDGQIGEHVLRGLESYVHGVSSMRRRP